MGSSAAIPSFPVCACVGNVRVLGSWPNHTSSQFVKTCFSSAPRVAEQLGNLSLRRGGAPAFKMDLSTTCAPKPDNQTSNQTSSRKSGLPFYPSCIFGLPSWLPIGGAAKRHNWETGQQNLSIRRGAVHVFKTVIWCCSHVGTPSWARASLYHMCAQDR